jgi:hypothetical protein
LTSKHEALSSNLSTDKKKKRRKGFGDYEMVEKCIESSFSAIVGVDSRLWWAEK